MKIILLEHPRHIEACRCNDIANTPLSSCLMSGYAAAVLEAAGHKVEIIEGFLGRLDYPAIRARIEAFSPDFLGVHMVYHWREDRTLFSFLAELRRDGLAPCITAYGFYPTIAFEDVLRSAPAVDAVILGEHEITIAELARSLRRHRRPDWGRIPGLAVRDGRGTAVTTAPRPLVKDLDTLPFPRRTPELLAIGEVNILGSRGCYNQCTFCYINPFYGPRPRWRGRTPENIADEVRTVLEQTGIRRFYFTDPNFFGPGRAGRDRAVRIAGLLAPLEIEFGIEARVNDIREDTIGSLSDAGLRHILIGLESGRDASLLRLNKNTTVAENETALAVLRRHGIEPNVGFIMFEPDATPADLRENLAFLERNNLLDDVARTANVLYHHQIVLRGTSAFAKLEAAGRLRPGPSPYEAEAVFTDPGVAALAEIMRRITNDLFQRMDGIWSGSTVAPPDSVGRYHAVNGILKDVFAATLAEIETGTIPRDREIEEIVRSAISRVAATLAPITPGEGRAPRGKTAP